MRISPVPLHKNDFVRSAIANGFTLTEAFSPPRKIPPHAHQSFSITLVLQGGFEERYPARHRPQRCEPGCLLVRPAGEIHEDEPGTKGARTLSLELSPFRLEVGAKTLAPILSLALRREAPFLDIARAMSRELRNADEAATLALESLSLELLARLIRVARARERGAAPGWLERARSSIQDRFREPSLRVSELAFEQGVHPVYFARAFRRYYRTSPGEYVRRLRLEWAWERIRYTPESLASIALDCGFADQSHLTRAFRRRFGASPGRLRRQAGS